MGCHLVTMPPACPPATQTVRVLGCLHSRVSQFRVGSPLEWVLAVPTHTPPTASASLGILCKRQRDTEGRKATLGPCWHHPRASFRSHQSPRAPVVLPPRHAHPPSPAHPLTCSPSTAWTLRGCHRGGSTRRVTSETPLLTPGRRPGPSMCLGAHPHV